MTVGTGLVVFAAMLAMQTASTNEPGPQSDQVASSQEDQDAIVVTGTPIDVERRTQIRRMAREVVRKPRNGYPIARFFLPVCPKVVGLAPADAETVERRIRDNARDFGPGERSEGDCEPNLKVVLLADSVGPADTWLDLDSDSISHLLSYQKQRVLDEKGPVRAWAISELRDFDGRPLESLSGVNNVRLRSRLNYSVTNEITGAMMLIEFSAVKDKTLQQLADYASMRAFVGADSVTGESGAPVDTILTLFDDATPPEGLTEFDRALISKLYSLPRNARTARIFGAVASRTINLEDASEDASRWRAEPR